VKSNRPQKLSLKETLAQLEWLVNHLEEAGGPYLGKKFELLSWVFMKIGSEEALRAIVFKGVPERLYEEYKSQNQYLEIPDFLLKD
jgi:Holliday junction resolvase